MTTPQLADLLPLALDITASLTREDRLNRMIELVDRLIPCDSVALLRLEGEELIPLASKGLPQEIYGRRFLRSEHPRLDIICSGDEFTLFPADSPLADPYDGLVIGEQETLDNHVHACLGCPLRADGKLVGVLTADALEAGAFDQLDHTFLSYLAALAGALLRTSDLIESLEGSAKHQGLVAKDLMQDAMNRRGSSIIGASDHVQRLLEEIEMVGRSEFPVLVSGETGVGKELVVRRLHANSPRADKALVYVNCAALPESIAESELFGHAKGAFTGADQERLGKFRVADGATLFLDEIGELPLHIQPKLLRALQEGEIQCIGSDEVLHVDVRILAASNRDLEAEVESGRFRSDLLHRLDVCRIQVEPLRKRPADIPLLAGHFADHTRSRLGTGPIRFSIEAQAILMHADWPGNVRELENSILRASLRAARRVESGEIVVIEGNDLDAKDPEVTAQKGSDSLAEEVEKALPMRQAVQEYQKLLIAKAVDRNNGNWSAAARDLQVERANLHHLAKRLGLK